MKVTSPHLTTRISSFVEKQKKRVKLYFRDNFCSEAQFRNFMDSSKGYEVKIVGLQNGDRDLVGTKSCFTDDNLMIKTTKILAQNGTSYNERVESYYPSLTRGEARAHQEGSKSTFLIDYGQAYDKGFSNSNEYVKEIFQIINDGVNPSIIHTKKSDEMQGHYEIEKYDLGDYPSDVDMISEIKGGRVFPSCFLSRIRTTKTGQKCEETYNYNKTLTHKIDAFSKAQDTTTKRRAYRITKSDGEKILDINRSFTQTPSMSITRINDKKYFAYFDDFYKKITILDGDNLADVFDLDSVYFANQKEKGSDKENLWKMFKALPADVLLDSIEYLKSVKYLPNKSYESCAYVTRGRINTCAKPPYYVHELGHLVTLNNDFDIDKDLLDTIEEEQKLLRDNFPNQYRASFEYLSTLVPDSLDYSGLVEILAETYLILKGFDQADDMGYRAQMIVQYFPKTTAKIAKMLDEIPKDS